MRMVFGLVLVVGVALAGFAVYMAKDRIGAYQAQLATERAALAQIVPTKDVFIMAKPIAYGQYLKKEDVKAIRWPENALPEGVFHSLEEIFPPNAEGERAALRRMEVNEPIMRIKVTEPGQDAGVGARLERGQRAYAIRVDVASGVSGFIRPGDRVDVYWTGRNISNPSMGDVTRLIEPGIQIVAIDQTADSDRSNPIVARTVTVSGTPEQVARLALAQGSGKLSLSLVGANDDYQAGAIDVDQKQLLGVVDAPIAAPVAKAQECFVTTRKGAETIRTPVQCNN
ncbi:Flp pilus assembly protein CpaB [Aliiroseovarius sp. PTFE2010]|uniref:Flp pilus assembly protein CpaB n=1 Tax=Aliiroseovarius sp. PTFE2010 TaxID=3417190 RepID=UPI003CF4D0D8